MLYLHFKMPSIILIDEYDNLINKILIGKDEELLRKAINFFKNFMGSTFK